ncbi:MAG: hypothetical protein QOH64_251 [Acidimicrobiaceae bacterium]
MSSLTIDTRAQAGDTRAQAGDIRAQAGDTQANAGWWLASDGKWYSPDQHPDWTAPTVSAATVAPAARRGEPDLLMRAVGRSQILFGIRLILIGVGITVLTFAMQLPIFLITWGPVVVGIKQIAQGMKKLNARL